MKKYKCSLCGYIYDEAEQEVKFADLPDDWVCPLCGVGKEYFEEIIDDRELVGEDLSRLQEEAFN